MQELIRKTYKKSITIFYAILLGTVLIGVAGSWLKGDFQFGIDKMLITGISSVTMLYLMASIFGALFFYNKKVKLLILEDELDIRYAKYLTWIKLRLLLIGSNCIINVILYLLVHEKSFLYAVGVAVIGLIFCMPSEKTIEHELNPIIENED